ncbi:TlpA family protein disulfide reductase [Chitinibacter bivalviorum]|uniref:TlpA family protein disulfide reductase n=1 Tax=Chitinibacter bivalviorum TaxID=2739434 RepID=A0A7H9BHC8_9NEIS|nr:TlpA disulfide reductase family protein [Chitinibacter bivalviorum]QLG86944.1 TlpA family protein disulfide reductase [Chitinibacter bivalviorum]
MIKQWLAILSLVASSASWAAPDFWGMSFPDLTGKPQPTKQWQGKMVVLNYWATWCSPCRQEMPEMVQLQKKYQGKVQFIGIAIDDPEPSAKFAKEIGVNYPTLIGSNSAMDLMRAQGNNLGGLPFTVFFDAKGKQVAINVGKISKEQIETQIKKYAP